MIQSKKEYKQYLELDRISSKIPQMSTMSAKIKQFLFPNYIWEFLKALRWLEYCENVKKKQFLGGLLWLFAKIRFRRISLKLGYSIPINVFGSGISLPHIGNIIINPHVKIGKNCRIHVGVNIGAHHDKSPHIADNVYIGPGAIIFGDVYIADNVSIGANATVNMSVCEANTVVAGTPAKIVKVDSESWNGIKPKVK